MFFARKKKGQYGCMNRGFSRWGRERGEGLVLKPKPRFNTRIDWGKGKGGRFNTRIDVWCDRHNSGENYTNATKGNFKITCRPSGESQEKGRGEGEGVKSMVRFISKTKYRTSLQKPG